MIPHNKRQHVIPRACLVRVVENVTPPGRTPAIVLVSTQKQPALYGLGAEWESPWMEATLPLSPRALLLISLHHPEGREVATTEAVREANLRSAVFATRVFANRPIDVATLHCCANWVWWLPVTDAVEPGYRGE